VGSLDLPDQTDEPDRAKSARDVGMSQSRAADLPDPDERGRVYEATRAYFSAKTADEGSPTRRPDAGEKHGYWNEVPRFLQMRDDLARGRSAERQSAVDRSADPPGSYDSDGDHYTDPERQAQATEAVGRVCEAEPTISEDVRTTGQENKYGGWLEGYEFRLKGEDRLKEKIAEQLESEPDKSANEILHKIPDAIRYTFCFQPENYAKGYYDIKERMESRGYEMYESRNSWRHAEYKGINTRWVTSAGQRFEIQFHTPESFHAKHHVTHAVYERIRNPATSRAELGELHTFQREVSSWVPVPDGATDIPDFKKEGFLGARQDYLLRDHRRRPDDRQPLRAGATASA
jgi:hypothetical protein